MPLPTPTAASPQMGDSCYASLIAAYIALAAEPLTPEGNPTFYALSQEAQDAIVWAVMAGDDEAQPKLSDAVKDEIRQWASSHNAESIHPETKP